MSLQVWLPLNGSLENQGLKGEEPSLMGNGITYTAGKIGQAATFPNNCNSCIHMSGLRLQIGAFTSWILVKGAGATSRQCIISEGRDSYNDGVEIYTSQAGTTIYFKAHEKILSTTIELNKWYHVSGVFGDGQVKLYLNGNLIDTITYTTDMTYQYASDLTLGKMSYSYTSTSNYFPFNGQLNDVRIYDHALSDKEVEEISKGLVLHYKLDLALNEGENLIPDSLNMPLGSADPATGTWRIAGTNNMTRSRVVITDTPDGNGYGFQNSGIQTANDGSCYGIDSFPMDANTVYTISLWARITSGTEGYAGFNVYNCTDIGDFEEIRKGYRVTKLSSSGEWIKCSYTFLTNSATTRNIYIGITTGDTDVTTQMCNVHLEKSVLFNNSIIYDSSGYNRIGEKIDLLTQNFDTSRYINSSFFNGSSSGILISNKNLAPILNEVCTISFWIKSVSENGARSIYFSSYNGSPFWCIEKSAGNKFRYDWNGSPDLYSNGSIVDGSWNFICLVRESPTNARFYLNGNLDTTFTTACNTLTNLIDVWRIGRDVRTNDGTPYHGSMSDFRIYATALTDAQIKELYNTSASIDNKGNIYARELVEE